ncbi:MAG TPA: hypothetical protein VGH28_02615 [Polyangiaceae bacterium]
MGPKPNAARLLAVATLLFSGRALAADLNATPATLDSILPTLAPGDTVHLAPGHYAHFSIASLNGTSSAWITITSDTPQAAIIDADPGPCCNTIDISQSSFVAIQNLMIDGHDVDGAFGVSAGGGVTASPTHDIRIEGNVFVNHHGSQQHDAISTKTPTWGWIIRGNRITSAGTGLYLGNSDGSDPFVAGVIENNIVEFPIGYCMEIKFQNAWPSIAGMPTGATTTIIRGNTFVKNDDPSPDGDRPNLLVGGFPASGPGSQNRYEIYGNTFAHNPRESLFQASGRVTVHDNVFVDAATTRAMLFQDHDLPLEQAYAYNNTLYDVGSGIVFGNAAPQGDGVAGNLIFSPSPISGPIQDQRDNLTDAVANAASYVVAPGDALGSFDFHPGAGACTGSAIDESKFANDTDYAVDFAGASKGTFTFRGAFAGGSADAGVDSGAGADASAGGDGGAVGTGGPSSGCGCGVASRANGFAGLIGLALAALAIVRKRGNRSTRLPVSQIRTSYNGQSRLER